MAEVQKSRVLHLNDILQFQPGAVVSRTLINQKAGTITLFAFAKDEELSEHTAPFDASAHLLDGEMEVTISGNRYRLKTGDLIIMPANQPHALRAITSSKMLLVMIRS